MIKIDESICNKNVQANKELENARLEDCWKGCPFGGATISRV